MSAFCIHDRDPESCAECESELEAHEAAIAQLGTLIRQAPPAVLPSPPVRYVCDCRSAEEERAAIVSWLRLTARTLRATRASEAYGFRLAADRIEAGEHLKEKA